MVIKNHRVYFVKCKDLIKIGSTHRPFHVRLSSLKTGNPFRMEGLGVIECDCPAKTNRPRAKCEKEHNIQWLFQKSKVEWLSSRTEWFHATPELLAYIKKHALKSSPEGHVIYDPPYSFSEDIDE